MQNTQKNTKKRDITPEETLSLSDCSDTPLRLTLICNQCKKKASYEFEYATVSPERPGEDDDWDGIVLSRIVECEKCGAVDDYRIDALSYGRLIGELLQLTDKDSRSDVVQPKEGGRLIIGVSTLWDGTVVRRPSKALAHLLEIAQRDPENGEAWRRLGNLQSRLCKFSEAEASWRKGLEVDPNEIECACCLAENYAEQDRWQEAVTYLRIGLNVIPKTKDLHNDTRLNLVNCLLRLVSDSLQITDERLALAVAWLEGETLKKEPVLTMSSIDLRKVSDWHALAEFLVFQDVFSVDFTSEIPDDDIPTILERYLSDRNGEASGHSTDFLSRLPLTTPVVRQSPRVGRNTPCPCGSGKKFKKCCG